MQKQHSTITTSPHSIKHLNDWVTMYNNNLHREEDRIDLKVLTTEEIAEQLTMMINNHHVQAEMCHPQRKWSPHQ